MKDIVINGKKIGETIRPFIIAEAGVNHENDMEIAKKMIREAAAAGADAIKFQTYKAEKIAASKSPAYWETDMTQREFFKQYDKFGEEEYRELAKEAEKQKIIFMSTPFDFESADYLDEIMPVFKISSSDLTNIPFIRHIAKKGKPIFLSTGASTMDEIHFAVNELSKTGNDKIVLLHCVLSYPTKYEDANLNMIRYLQKAFPDHIVGYSDHTLPDKNMIVLLIAAMLGAKVIEKHFTLDKTLPGNDHYHAMDPADLKSLIENFKILEQVLGEYTKRPIEAELPARQNARRSLVLAKDVQKGHIIQEEDLVAKRPGTGISPIYFDLILGKKILKNKKEDDILTWDDFFEM